MSGGSMDYVYQRLENVSFSLNTLERKAFAKHLILVAQALHDIEWVDSSDYAPGDENEAICACISQSAMLVVAEEEVVKASNDLRKIQAYAPPPPNRAIK